MTGTAPRRRAVTVGGRRAALILRRTLCRAQPVANVGCSLSPFEPRRSVRGGQALSNVRGGQAVVRVMARGVVLFI